MQKTCRGCGELKPYTDYYANPNVKQDGRLNWCKPCVNERHKAAREARRRRVLEYVQSVKLERGCVDCGYREHAEALEFDHLPEFVKTQNLAYLTNGSKLAIIVAEIAKCEVVCANCHRVRTARRRVPDKGAAALI